MKSTDEMIKGFDEYKEYLDKVFPSEAPHQIVVMGHDEFIEWKKSNVGKYIKMGGIVDLK